MRVRDLIAKLQQYPLDAPVVLPDLADVVAVSAHGLDADGGHAALDAVVLSDRCDHKFIDSLRCLKCGWTP